VPKRIIKQYAYKNAFFDPNPAWKNPGYTLQGKGVIVEDMPLALSPENKEKVESIVEQKQAGMADLNKMAF